MKSVQWVLTVCGTDWWSTRQVLPVLTATAPVYVLRVDGGIEEVPHEN